MSEFRIERDSMGDVQVPARLLRRTDAAGGRELPDLRLAAPAGADPRPGVGEVRGAVANRDLGKLTGTGKRRLPARAGRGPAGRLPRSGRGKARRRIPDRRLPDRLGHVEQHERQRGDRQPGDRAAGRRSLLTGQADPSQRPRQHGAEHQRHFPHGDPRGRRPGDQAAT